MAKAKTAGRKPIASDLQQEVIHLVASGKTKVDVAKQLKIGEVTVYII